MFWYIGYLLGSGRSSHGEVLRNVYTLSRRMSVIIVAIDSPIIYKEFFKTCLCFNDPGKYWRK